MSMGEKNTEGRNKYLCHLLFEFLSAFLLGSSGTANKQNKQVVKINAKTDFLGPTPPPDHFPKLH